MTQEEITHYLFLPNDPDPTADLAIVFGINRFWRAGDKAIYLYKTGYIHKFIFSGGINKHNRAHEGPLMAQYAQDHGMPESAILIDAFATNTLENVLHARTIIEEKIGLDNVLTITLVCTHHHSRRVLMTMKKHFPPQFSSRLLLTQLPTLPRIPDTKLKKAKNWYIKSLIVSNVTWLRAILLSYNA